VLQLYADRVRLNGWLAAGCMALGMLLILDARLSFLAVLPIAYATVYVGMLNPHKSGLLFTGDYSYGLYLFAFPIQQALVHLYPAYSWWGVNAAVTLVVSFSYAALSWWLIERPILSRKQWVSAIADRLAASTLHRIRSALPARMGQTKT
jgi:peptidoglycan/LPS O-acetylase OafA/YrhL